MAGILDVLFPAATATAGALSNRAQKSSQTTTSSRTFNPQTKATIDQLMAKYQSLLSSGPGGYMAKGLQNINRASDLRKQSAENILAARGISGPASASPIVNLENERFRDVIDFQNKAPLDFLGQITQGISQLPLEENQTSTSNSEVAGNKLGGATTGLAAALAQIYGQGGGMGGKALSFDSITNGLHFLTGLGKGGAGAVGSWGVPGTGVGGEIASSGSKMGTTLPGAIKGGIGKLAGLAGAHPFIAAGIGAGIGASLLAKHFVGQGRRAADALTGEGGLQRGFEQTLNEIDSMQLPDELKIQYKNEAYQELVKQGLEHAKKGDNQSKVVTQMFDTISPLFGQANPLKAQMTGAQSMLQKFTGGNYAS